MRKYLLLFSLLLLVFCQVAYAEISFTNGFFSTTFDCPSDFDVNTISSFPGTCDSATQELDFSNWNNAGCTGNYSGVTSAANYSGGDGGRGWVQPLSINSLSNEGDNLSIDVSSTAPTELWWRFYWKLNATGDWSHGKTLYIYPNGSFSSNPYFKLDLSANAWTTTSQCSANDSGTTGWSDVTGGTGHDTEWHSIEFHLTTNTGDPGMSLEWWIDGVWRDSATWPSGCATTSINHIDMYTQCRNSDAGCEFFYIDDLAVALSTYAGFIQDGQGRDMIGPVGEDTTAPEVSSVSVDEDGETVTFTFTEPTSQGSGYNDSDVDLDCSTAGNNVALTYVSGDGSAMHVYASGSTIQNDETCNFDFNGNANSWEDGSGNDANAVVDGTVINGSQQGIATNSGHVGGYSSDGHSVTFGPSGYTIISQ